MNVPDTDLGIINVRGQSWIRLGRVAEGNDYVLPHPAVSAHHAMLTLASDGNWWVMDLNSDHGTYVNQRRVGPGGLPIALEKDTLWIAPFALRLSSSADTRHPRPAHLRLDVLNLQRKAGTRTLLDLRGTPLSFKPGEFIAIVGGSGAGKSTFLKALLGMDTIPGRGREGDIYFNNQLLIQGADIHAFAPLNTIVGYVPQQDDSLHFQLSAREALDFTARLRFASDVDRHERRQRVKVALEMVKLEREDLQTKPIAQLSGGQRKRVNMAVELVADPRLLFLDEPTSGLDPGLDLEVMSLLERWARGGDSIGPAGPADPKTIVLITHATENVRLCDYIVFMGGIRTEEEERGGCVLYFGPPGQPACEFFGQETFSEVYRLVEQPEVAAHFHTQLTTQPQWSQVIWERARSPQDLQESQRIQALQVPVKRERRPLDLAKVRRQFMTLASRYWLLLRRDRGAFLFQLFQGALAAMLLWGVAAQDAFTVAGVQEAPTTIFILSIAATWLGILNASKEIVKERRVFGRERRYGVGAIPYVLSKVLVLGTLGLWQMATLLAVTLYRFAPESHMGTLGRRLPEGMQLLIPLEFEWFITLELMLLAGICLGLCISAFARSPDQATLLVFPAMLIQVLLAGLLFDVGPFAWLAFTHWGLRALGNSLSLQELFTLAGKASDPILDKLDFASNGFTLFGNWLALLGFSLVLTALACWRQSWKDKARIPED